MSRLLEILGRAMTLDMTDLIWHWFAAVKLYQTSDDSPQMQRLDKIIELATNKKTKTAAEQLKSYLFDNPHCPRGRLAAAAISLHKNQISNAIEELNSVYMRQPNNTMALYALGHCYERLGKETQAIEFYQDCLKFKNYLQLPRQRLAAVYFKNRQFEKAIQEYELLKAEYPDDISTLVTLGHLYIINTQYARAIESFNTAILIHPDNFHTTEDDDIEQLIADGQLQEALENIDDLLLEKPERADLNLKRADILGMLGATSEAVSAYEEALSIFPDFLEATIKLGTQYLQLQQDRFAAQQFNRAIEINDQIVDAYLGLAIAHKLDVNESDSLTTLSLAAAIDANSSLLFAETATLQFKIGLGVDLSSCKSVKAEELIEEVIGAHRRQIAAEPQNPDLQYRLGILMMGVGRMSEASKSFKIALQINPTYTRARNKMAICLFETDHKQNALEQLIGPECLDRDTLELHYKIAVLYCDRLKFASSLINLERYMEENFASSASTVNISIVLQNLGIVDRATAMWDNLSYTVRQAANAGRLL
jgi:tetratricopeptide (TPR) repeat protein